MCIISHGRCDTCTGLSRRAPRALAAATISSGAIDVSVIDARGDSLPFADESMDGALCAFTLCIVPRPASVLAEIHRVLKPGAALHFLEHGLSPDHRMQRWQRRPNGWEQRLEGGCQLVLDPLELVSAAYFVPEWSEQAYVAMPTPWIYLTLGLARRASG